MHSGGDWSRSMAGTSRQGRMCSGRRVWKQHQGTPTAPGVGGGGGVRGIEGTGKAGAWLLWGTWRITSTCHRCLLASYHF